ncbi:MAG: hypothetical protein NT139_01880 [Candidatus Woesearchaeota archaeon]|nr:hypothetical protein [Candidatus Woesearchaeota archaeon]
MHIEFLGEKIKCAICGEKIETTFLEKIKGTYIKKKTICSNCQRKYKDKLKEKIK